MALSVRPGQPQPTWSSRNLPQNHEGHFVSVLPTADAKTLNAHHHVKPRNFEKEEPKGRQFSYNDNESTFDKPSELFFTCHVKKT